jgi:hypothetical protein
MSRPITIADRASATEALAYRRALQLGLEDQQARGVARYANGLVLTGTSSYRALGLAMDRAARMAVHRALRRADHYARVLAGESTWSTWGRPA